MLFFPSIERNNERTLEEVKFRNTGEDIRCNITISQQLVNSIYWKVFEAASYIGMRIKVSVEENSIGQDIPVRIREGLACVPNVDWVF